MSDTKNNPQADLAFLRTLASDTGAGLARDGAVMISVGTIFCAVSAVYWLIFAGYARPGGVGAWLWVAGLVLFFATTPFIHRLAPLPTGAASRGLAAAWGSVGVSMVAPCVGVIFAGARMGNGQLVLWVFPILLFTLYGAAWMVASAMKRQAWTFLVGAGCFVAAFAEGFLFGTPHQWLVLSIGLLVLVALPGWVLFRQARAA